MLPSRSRNNKIVVPKHQVPSYQDVELNDLFIGRANFKRRNLSFKDDCVTHYYAIVTLFIDREDEVTRT
jgi:hypothetical protein